MRSRTCCSLYSSCFSLGRCCQVQPPHTLACLQTGSIRCSDSSTNLNTLASTYRLFLRITCISATSPGAVPETNTATPLCRATPFPLNAVDSTGAVKISPFFRLMDRSSNLFSGTALPAKFYRKPQHLFFFQFLHCQLKLLHRFGRDRLQEFQGRFGMSPFQGFKVRFKKSKQCTVCQAAG